MSLSEDLEKLNELHKSGALSLEEFDRAKARLLGVPDHSVQAPPARDNRPSMQPSQQTRNSSDSITKKKQSPALLIVLVVILAGLLWGAFRTTTPQQVASNPLLSAVASLRPVDLLDEIENLPANSIKGVPITLPYGGTLTLEVQVVRGNPVDIFLVDPSEVESISARKEFHSYQGFNAEKSMMYSRQGRIAPGTYDVVFIDRSLGILSASASDIKVKAHLSP